MDTFLGIIILLAVAYLIYERIEDNKAKREAQIEFGKTQPADPDNRAAPNEALEDSTRPEFRE